MISIDSLRKALTSALVLLAGITGTAYANPQPWQLNMAPGVTQTSQQAYHMHMIALIICGVIGVVVFGAMIISMVRDRKSKGVIPAKWSHNTTAEIIWTIIPILILVGMAAPATGVLIKMADSSKAEMTIKITGYQWKWRYEYLDYRGQEGLGINFISSLDKASDRTRQLKSGLDPWSVKTGEENTYLLNVDHPLVIPTDTKIRFVVTADDVIHSWWVPALGWKADAIPGIINDAWTNVEKPGVYRGQCAELCGRDHAFMPIVVEAKPRKEFEQWLVNQKSAKGSVEETVSSPANSASSTSKISESALDIRG